jgi:hypothetical protein
MTTTPSGERSEAGQSAIAPRNRRVSRLLWGVIFYGLILPTGLISRALRLGRFKSGLDRGAATYWRDRRGRGSRPA